MWEAGGVEPFDLIVISRGYRANGKKLAKVVG